MLSLDRHLTKDTTVFASRKRWFRLLYLGNLALLLWLIGYQVLIHVTDPDHESVHVSQLERISERTDERDALRFAVVGHIKNSLGIFRDQIVPELNAEDLDFMISAGNAVSGGHEEGYRKLHKILAPLDIPYLLTFGPNEESDFGSFRFYEQFGPHFFSFEVGGVHFIFLDGTGKSSFTWQLRWLERELTASTADHRFVFIGLPVHEPLEETPILESDHYLEDPELRADFRHLFEQYGVDVVFSSNLTLYSQVRFNGVDYVTTGGAGGLVINDEASFHHYVAVQVDDGEITVVPVELNIDQPAWRSNLESLWISIYSWVNVSLFRFMVAISALILLAAYLHRQIFRDRDYYPNFDVDLTPYQNRSLKIGMYSNNYFPFVSGVTVSVERLRQGLLDLGDKVLLFAPDYGNTKDDDKTIVRAPTLMAFGAKGEFRLANPFPTRLRKALRQFSPDIIHVHHPFWLGTLGLIMGRILNVPVVYTYHTRLEHYAHFVPLPGLLFRNLISHYLIRRFSNRCQGVIVPTDSTEEYLRIIGVTTHTLVQPTGIDVQRFREPDADRVAALRRSYGLGDDEVVLISVSRISKEKNIDFMLDSLTLLKARTDQPFRLLMVGDGPDRGATEQRIRDKELDKNVTLVGAVPPDDMVNYYHLGDIFVFASRSETQGMVILEAMSAGLPVVAVRSSGIDDVIGDGDNGFKTPLSHPKWAERVQQLMESKQQRQTMGEAAQRFSGDYDISCFARQIHDFYAYLLAQQR